MKATLLSYQASDLDAVNAARISYNNSSKTLDQSDEKLIRYLLKNGHFSPFEHTFFKWHIKAPIFVAREWMRHRIGVGISEMSARYVEIQDEFYHPTTLRKQVGKPGNYSYQPLQQDQDKAQDILEHSYKSSYYSYKLLLEKGVAKEQARMVLPQAIMTQWIWSANARSLMHLLKLRLAQDAQEEIRELAKQLNEDFAKIMPISYKYFHAEVLNSSYESI